MQPTYKIERTTYGPWGQTQVEYQFAQHDWGRFYVQGHADISTCEIGIMLVERGATISTVTYAIAKKPGPFRPIAPRSGLLGILLLLRDGEHTVVLVPECDETLTLSIGPTDIVVVADNGSLIREVHRAPLLAIAAMQTEALLPEVASAVQRLTSPVQSPASRPLLVAAS